MSEPSRPRLLVVQPTALEVVDELRAWIESQGAALDAEASYNNLDERALADLLARADGVVLPAGVRAFPSAQRMRESANLLVCSVGASGYEWLDVAAATREGIVVTNAPGGDGAEVVADLAWGLLLAVARQIPHHHAQVTRGNVQRGMGVGVSGKTLGVIGLGHIGRSVAQRATGFAMTVLASDAAPHRDFAAANGIELVSTDELLRRSDFVSLNLRLSRETHHCIGARELTLMKPSAILINTARRELVDEAALVDAILSGHLAGAGLDDPPGDGAKRLLGLPNVVFTPHLGNRAIEGVRGVLRLAIENCLRVFRGERPDSVVNPEVYDSPALRRAARPRWTSETSPT